MSATCDGCDQDPWRTALHYGSCPLRDLTDCARAEVGVGGVLVVCRTDLPDPHGEDRTVYAWEIYGPDLALLDSASDLHTGVGSDPGPRAMLAALISFLEAASEAYQAVTFRRHMAENASLFPWSIAEWAYMHDSELSMLALELSEDAER